MECEEEVGDDSFSSFLWSLVFFLEFGLNIFPLVPHFPFVMLRVLPLIALCSDQ